MPCILNVIYIIGIRAASVTTSSLTATSVTISWSPQPAQFRLPVVEYTVSLTRVTGSGQAYCTQFMDSRPAVTTTATSMSFSGLEEFSNYTVTVTTTFNVFGSNMPEVAEIMFTTSSAGMDISSFDMHAMFILIFNVAPTGAPRDVTPSMTSRSIMVTWDTIECIKSNGIITNYTVVFQEQGGANVPDNTVDRTFSAGGLTPYTNYTFQVAGINDVGTGPYTNAITITTAEYGSYIN